MSEVLQAMFDISFFFLFYTLVEEREESKKREKRIKELENEIERLRKRC